MHSTAVEWCSREATVARGAQLQWLRRPLQAKLLCLEPGSPIPLWLPSCAPPGCTVQCKFRSLCIAGLAAAHHGQLPRRCGGHGKTPVLCGPASTHRGPTCGRPWLVSPPWAHTGITCTTIVPVLAIHNSITLSANPCW